MAEDGAAMQLLQKLADEVASDPAAAAMLLNAVLYLAGRDRYVRLTNSLQLDVWIRRALEGGEVWSIKPRCEWTLAESSELGQLYAETPTREICLRLGRTIGQVYREAFRQGLHKSVELLRRESALNMKRPEHRGRLFQFKKGLVPHNKGLRRPGWYGGRMRETQFVKGQKPKSWKPLGSERVSKDGYLQRKVTDTGRPPRDWRGVHLLVWEEVNGLVPAGHAVCFLDGDKTRIVIENLELITRAQLMRRNTIHNLPKELAEVIQLNGALKRVLRRKHEEQDVRSA